MGTDIHGWVEYHTGEGWESLFAFPSAERNYELFGRMAGVRWCELAMFEPKGLPDDLSYWGNIWSYDFRLDHSQSHLTTAEFKAVVEALKDPSAQARAWLAAMESVDRARIVFGFDS